MSKQVYRTGAIFAKLVLFLWTSLALAQLDVQKANEIIRRLNQIPLIRVAIGAAPGNGHQAAGAAVVQRLGEIGYQGKIEIVYDTKGTGDKLVYLLPPFNGLPAGPVQEFPHLRWCFIYGEMLFSRISNANTVPLCIMGADDHGTSASRLQAEALLKFQPLNWHTSPSLSFANEAEPLSFPDLNSKGFLTKAPAPDNIDQFLIQELSHSQFIRKQPFLSKLLQKSPAYEILPVYGHGVRKGDGQLEKLLQALALGKRKDPDFFAKGLIIPVLNELAERHITNIQQTLPELQKTLAIDFYQVDDPKLLSLFQEGLKNRVVVVNLGPLPKRVFEYLYSRQTLPGIVEGLNSIHFMHMLGLPYLPSAYIEGYQFSLLLTHLTDFERMLRNAWQALYQVEPNEDLTPLTDFYLQAYHDKPTFSQYFKKFQMNDLNDDQFLLGLEKYFAEIDQRKTAGGPPLKQNLTPKERYLNYQTMPLIPNYQVESPWYLRLNALQKLSMEALETKTLGALELIAEFDEDTRVKSMAQQLISRKQTQMTCAKSLDGI